MQGQVSIICVGDSLTVGYPRHLKDILSQRRSDISWNVSNFGHIGSTTTDWLSNHVNRPDFKAAASSADVFLVMLGTNDCQTGVGLRGLNETQLSNNIQQLALKLRNIAPRASIILASPPPTVRGGSFEQFIDAVAVSSILPRIIPEIARNLNIRHVDVFAALGGAQPVRQAFNPDGVHMTPEGDKLVATAMAGAVLQSLEGLAPAIPCENQPLSFSGAMGSLASAIVGAASYIFPSLQEKSISSSQVKDAQQSHCRISSVGPLQQNQASSIVQIQQPIAMKTAPVHAQASRCFTAQAVQTSTPAANVSYQSRPLPSLAQTSTGTSIAFTQGASIGMQPRYQNVRTGAVTGGIRCQ